MPHKSPVTKEAQRRGIEVKAFTMYLPVPTIQAIKLAVIRESYRQGRRVTQAELVSDVMLRHIAALPPIPPASSATSGPTSGPADSEDA